MSPENELLQVGSHEGTGDGINLTRAEAFVGGRDKTAGTSNRTLSQEEWDPAMSCNGNPCCAIDLLLLEMGEVWEDTWRKRESGSGEYMADDDLFHSSGVMHVAVFDKIRKSHAMHGMIG